MKFEWNLIRAMLKTEVDDLEALRQKELKIKSCLVWFYQIGLILLLVLFSFKLIPGSEARAVTVVFVVGILLYYGLSYWSGTCLLRNIPSKRELPILEKIFETIFPCVFVGVSVGLCFPSIGDNFGCHVLAFLSAFILSYLFFTFLFNHFFKTKP